MKDNNTPTGEVGAIRFTDRFVDYTAVTLSTQFKGKESRSIRAANPSRVPRREKMPSGNRPE
jgi:hypothetical protein